MKKINIAVIGTGQISVQACQWIALSEQANLQAICGRNTLRVKALAETYQADNAYTSLEKLLADETTEVVYIATPNATHYDYVKKALASSKHVIVEKTAFYTTEQAEEMFQLAEQNRVMLFEAMRTIYEPNFAVLTESLQKIGELHSVSLKYQNYSKQCLQSDQPAILDEAHGGGTLRTIGIYPIYIAVALFGKPEAVFYHQQKQEEDRDFGGTLVLDYKTHPVVIAVSKIANSTENYSEFYGSKGTVTLDRCFDIQSLTYYPLQKESKTIATHAVTTNGLEHEFSYFIKTIQTNSYKNYRQAKLLTLLTTAIIETALDFGKKDMK
ncbi:Gfo/Idh/MocA family oxidoreductase [Listeria grandensis]|uniref:Gfo/Idh/MocA family oxidoreductase n=1 Tax=Listeria grandensis TaxID=1494963 RepID=A0A7X0Y3K5_9LIST|nr:Gfo/Idh/MocA family oxidoreductase [Listeria grandensis]MBC1936335.1 Gfo/Idh/MocA family oxidoreductase [Listeria grandensis]